MISKRCIQAKTLEKIHANQNENKTKNTSRKSNPRLTLLYTIFHEKGTPFNTLFRTLYPFWLLYINALLFFYIEINLKNSLYTDVIFLFVPTPLYWRSINPLRFIFYHPRSVDFEKEIEGLWTGYLKNRTFSRLLKPYHSSISPTGPFNRPKWQTSLPLIYLN